MLLDRSLGVNPEKGLIPLQKDMAGKPLEKYNGGDHVWLHSYKTSC